MAKEHMEELPLDAIIALGGGSQRREDPCSLPWFVLQRLDAAHRVFNTYVSRLSTHRPKVVLLSVGTTHKPNFINAAGWPIGESTSGALYLLQCCGKDGSCLRASDIIRETSSLDTIGNAYFLRTTHADPARWRRLHIITSDFHGARTAEVFDFIFHCRGADGTRYEMSYECTPSAPQTAEERLILHARSEKEAEGRKTFHAVLRDVFGVVTAPMESVSEATQRVGVTLREVHAWLFSKHTAYATHSEMVGTSTTVNAEVLQTY